MRGMGRGKDGASEVHKDRKGDQRSGSSVSETKVKLVLVSSDRYSVTSPLMLCPFSLVSQHHKSGLDPFGE